MEPAPSSPEPPRGLPAARGLHDAMEDLRAELERSRSERAVYAERYQAQEEELRRLRERLATAEGEAKMLLAKSKARERELEEEVENSVQRERMLRSKFEEELKRLSRLKAAAEAEARETLQLKEKELASSLSLQEEMVQRHRTERRRLEELAASHQAELGRLRAVLEALDEKLVAEAGGRSQSGKERESLERLMASLLKQNSKLAASLEESHKRRDLAERELAKDIEAALDRVRRGPVADPVLTRELEDQRAKLEAEVLRLDKENDELRALAQAACDETESWRAQAQSAKGRQEADVDALNATVATLQEKIVDLQARLQDALADRQASFQNAVEQFRSRVRPSDAPAAPQSPAPSFLDRFKAKFRKD